MPFVGEKCLLGKRLLQVSEHLANVCHSASGDWCGCCRLDRKPLARIRQVGRLPHQLLILTLRVWSLDILGR